MIGKKFYKGQYSDNEYLACAIWCTETQLGTLVDKGEYYEVVENTPYVPTTEERIAQLKAELATYDYIGVKIAMGVATKEEYAEQIAYTQSLRAKINALS